MSIELVIPSNHLILCLPLLLLSSVFLSIRVFSNESVLRIRWWKYWSSSFSINPSNEYLGLISFKMDWFCLLAVQGTLKSLLQHHSSKASVLRCSTFFRVQLSHPYMTTRKTIALTRQTFVGKVMSLIFNMLSRSRAGVDKLWPRAQFSHVCSSACFLWLLLQQSCINATERKKAHRASDIYYLILHRQVLATGPSGKSLVHHPLMGLWCWGFGQVQLGLWLETLSL